MQSLPGLQEKIFFEVKNILESLSRIDSPEELLRKHELFSEAADRIAFLRILDENKDSLASDYPIHHIDNEQINPVSNDYIQQEELNPEGLHFEEDIIEEEVLFTNELNDISDDRQHIEGPEPITEPEGSEAEEITDIETIGNIESPELQVNPEYNELPEVEETRRQIVEIPKHEPVVAEQTLEAGTSEETATEKKFRLANIKGLKTVQNIFNEDPLEQLSEKTPSAVLPNPSVSTEFMEAPKAKPEFRLDLNDRVAFTKFLFRGNEDELKKTVDRLNSFTDLEEARGYLSDIYYQNDWRKVDDYAQRLWGLVENKFL